MGRIFSPQVKCLRSRLESGTVVKRRKTVTFVSFETKKLTKPIHIANSLPIKQNLVLLVAIADKLKTCKKKYNRQLQM